MVVDQQRILEVFFPVYVSENTKVNVLSFVDVEDLYDIMYIQKQAFIVHMKDRDIVFHRREKLCIADGNDMAMVGVTVQEGEWLYSKEEVCKAKIAEAVHLLMDGSIRNILALVVADIERAYDIYGVHTGEKDCT